MHLARRDVYFERAASRIVEQARQSYAEPMAAEYEEILFLLRTARQHARISIRNAGKNSHDEQFSLFITLLAGNVKAVLSMLNLKGMVESSQGSAFSFLGENQASAGLQAEEYQRRANDIVRSIQKTLELAREPFETLKAENRGTASHEENERYEKARSHFLEELDRQKPIVHPMPRIIRKFLRT